MKIGYARVSTADQRLDLQLSALEKEDCTRIFNDVGSGSQSLRQGLEKALGYLREGDTLVVWRLDRLGRSLQNLIEIMESLAERKIAFKSIQESIDTNTSGGKLIFHMFGALAEFESNLIRERTEAGLMAARARGRLGGAPSKLMPKDVKRMLKMYNDSQRSTDIGVKDICKIFGISKTSFYNYLKRSKNSASK